MLGLLQQLEACTPEDPLPVRAAKAREVRKEAILQHILKSPERILCSDLGTEFPGVTRGTIASDIAILITEGKVCRAGHGYVKAKVRGGMV